MLYIISRFHGSNQFVRDLDLWRTLVPKVEPLDDEAIWKVWLVTDVLRSDNVLLHAYNQNQGWQSAEMMTQTAPSYLHVTQDGQQTTFTAISISQDGLESLIALVLNLYGNLTFASLVDFLQRNQEVLVRTAELFHRETGDKLQVTFEVPISLSEVYRRYSIFNWDYLKLLFIPNLDNPLKVLQLYIKLQASQAWFVLIEDEQFMASKELDQIYTLLKLADITYGGEPLVQ